MKHATHYNPPPTEPQGTPWHELRHEPVLQWALEVAATGGHSLRVIGPATCGADQAQSVAVSLGVPSCLWAEPCACGNLGDTHHECTCTPRLVERWRRRLKRRPVDICLTVARPGAATYRSTAIVQPLADVLARVEAARLRPRIDHRAIDYAAQTLLDTAIERLGLSPDARRRILAVAESVDRLGARDRITASAIAQAVQFAHEREFSA